MKISSGKDDEPISIQTLNQDELELISAFIEQTILGKNKYAHAAFTLHEKIANAFGPNFTEIAYKKVQPIVYELNSSRSIVGRIQPGNYEFKV